MLNSVPSTENIGLPNLTPLLFSTALIVGLRFKNQIIYLLPFISFIISALCLPA